MASLAQRHGRIRPTRSHGTRSDEQLGGSQPPFRYGLGACIQHFEIISDSFQVALESGGAVSKEEALAMASSNIEKLLGIDSVANTEFAVTSGGDIFSLDSKVVGMISSRRGVVDLF